MFEVLAIIVLIGLTYASFWMGWLGRQIREQRYRHWRTAEPIDLTGMEIPPFTKRRGK